METNIELCLQGKLALRLQETSAPEFVNLLFQTLKFVSGVQMGWHRGQGKAKEEQRKEHSRGRGNCGSCPLFNMHLYARIPLKTKPPADLRGWQQSQGHQYLRGQAGSGGQTGSRGTGSKRGDRAEGSLDNSYSFLNPSFHCSSRSWNSALRMALQLK